MRDRDRALPARYGLRDI